MSGGGRFDFDDGGTYVGGWEDGKAHGFGVCTGPKGQGEYSGAWVGGFEVSGVYTWPSGNCFEGQWMQGKRHGLGVENKGRWLYRGEWTQGFKGRYGVRLSTSSGAKYEGTWTTGLQDGYGVETYADGGGYQGQWLRGMRHGYGVRASVPYGLASHYRPKTLRTSLTSLRSEQEEEHVVKDRDRKLDESRGGFVLQAKSDDMPNLRKKSLFDKQGRLSIRNTLNKLKLKKQASTGDIVESKRRHTSSVRSTISNISHASADSSQSGVTTASMYTDSNNSFVSQDDINDSNVTETYMGEWKTDKRSGFGVSERSDGLKYEGEWYNNKKYGHGVTTFKDGSKEEGKYKNNVLVSSGKKSKLFGLRSSKLRERVENATAAAQRAAQIALQKADIAISRMANARSKAEQADQSAAKANTDSDQARLKAKEVAPEFHQPGTEILKKRLHDQSMGAPPVPDYSVLKVNSINHTTPAPRPLTSAAKSSDHHGSNSVVDGKPRQNAMSALVSSVLDTSLAGSSTNIANTLHHLDEDKPPNRNPAFSSRTNTKQFHRQEANHHPMSETPRTPITANQIQQRKINFLQNMPPEQAERFSQLLNSTVVKDHFDQYGTLKDDSGLGKEFAFPDETVPHGYTPDHSLYARQPNGGNFPMSSLTGRPMDRSPDSGVSDSDDLYRSAQSRPIQRRKTLPSIIKVTPLPNSKSKSKAGEKVHSQQNLSLEDTDTYIIENGIRKRVKAEINPQPEPEEDPTTAVSGDIDDTETKKKDLPKRYMIEAPSGRGKRGSLPDVTACKALETSVMPRHEVHILSERRRKELRILREAEERRRQQEIVLRLGDFKEWVQERQLLMLVIALNISLASMFFNLLS